MNSSLRRALLIGFCSLLAFSLQGQILYQSTFASGALELNPPTFKGVDTTGTGLFSNNLWKVTANNIDWVGNTYGWQAPPSGAQNVVDLNGFTCGVGQANCTNSPIGSIVAQASASSPLTAGRTYSLTFYYSGNPEYLQSSYGLSGSQITQIQGQQSFVAGIATTAAGTTSIASQSFTFTNFSGQTASGSVMNWQTANWQFTVPSTYNNVFVYFNSTSSFSAADYGLASWGAVIAAPVLSDITPGVPEPAAFLMMGAGLVALAALRRRK